MTAPTFSRVGSVTLSSGGGMLEITTEIFSIKYTAHYRNPAQLMLSSASTYISGTCPGSK